MVGWLVSLGERKIGKRGEEYGMGWEWLENSSLCVINEYDTVAFLCYE